YAGLDPAAVPYTVKARGGDALTVSRDAYALDTGVWDDPLLSVGDGSGLGFLMGRQAYEEGVGANLLSLGAKLLQGEMERTSNEGARTSAELSLAYDQQQLVERWLSRTEVYQDGVLVKPGFSYRTALTESNLELPPDEQAQTAGEQGAALTSAAAVIAATDDGEDIGHISRDQDQSGYENELLERYNNVKRRMGWFSESLTLASEEDAQAASMFTDYLANDDTQALLTAVQNDSLTGIDDMAKGIISANNPDEDAYAQAQEALGEMEQKIASIKQGICLAAESYEASMVDKDAYRTNVLVPLQDKITGLKGTVKDKENDYLAAESTLTGLEDDWTAKQDALTAAYDALQEAQQQYKTREAVKEYAESVYLTTGSDDQENIVDPDTRLSYAQDQLDRANRRFAGLRDLFTGEVTERPDATQTNDEVNTAFTEYEDSYTDYLWLAEAVGLLQGAVDDQQALVEDCKNNVEKQFSKFKNNAFFDSSLYNPDAEVNYFTEDKEYDFSRDIDGRNLEQWLASFTMPGEGQSGLGTITYDAAG
ncbi:MAG: hypothetical protein P8107_14630, partial [Spirochaetia bacterium]